RPSRLSAPSPYLPHQQHSPTPVPTPGGSPDSQPNGPAAAAAKSDVKADASRPNAPAAVAGGSGTSTPSRTADDSSHPAAVDADATAIDAAGVNGGEAEDDGAVAEVRWETCKVRRGVSATDYIPCLDNIRAIKALRSRRHMEHRERHCPAPPPRCLVRMPAGYRLPVPWPRSRDMIWYNNVPHPKLVEYKKDQNWVTKSGDYLVFPGGGTQFKDGVARYIQFVEQIMPTIQWGTHTRTVLDVGCGVASFGGYLLDRNVITMSLAPKDEHEAQIQFALERGIPAFLGVIGTQKLPFPDNAFDVVHCARCRVHWYANGGKPLLELNRVLRPGGFFVWSATPVYRKEQRDQDDWNAMVTLTKSMCWRTVVKSEDINGIGVVIYQKPTSNSCYLERKTNEPHLCSKKDGSRFPWYV
uniref:Methyltransferase n=1 Tax=Aegilops tauschii subsp. strangulata TaxID=200361 RepID=A0A452ZC59_AEGTS